MEVINHNRALMSLDKSLVPSPHLIDGRSEKDTLGFLSEFASLINFYDTTNTHNGTWVPFLLKDPVILVASISATPFSAIHSMYLTSCKGVTNALDKGNNKILANLDQLLDQLFEVFIRVERWTWYMVHTDKKYSLEKYVLHQVENNIASLYWALLSLREEIIVKFNLKAHLASHDYILNLSKEVFPNNESIVNNSKELAFQEKVWQTNKNKSPFTEILHLTDFTLDKIVPSVINAGDQLFTFFKTVIDQSAGEFETLDAKKSNYPDTLLLRTFANLLSPYREQLNGIAKKHLKFYYRDILKQKKNGAIADKVYLTAQLAKLDAAFNLPSGTQFDAGTDADKNPIYFESSSEVSLNPVDLASAYTLFKSPNTNNCSLYLEKVSDPSTVQKSEDGTIQSWETFGGTISSDSKQVEMGCAIASPLLLLMEGTRTIQMEMTFVNEITPAYLSTAKYYVSTQTDWFKLPAAKPGLSPKSKKVTLEFTLKPTDPPIEAFLENPDGYSASWPLFKMVFKTFSNIQAPPQLKTLTITTTVTEAKTFQLYNDFGILSTKTPFQPLGPMSDVNNSFMIGSAEIFSKPVDTLSIAFDWANLPDGGFLSYYQQYNDFLGTQNKQGSTTSDSNSNPFVKWIRKIIFGTCPTPPDSESSPFNNECFEVRFDLLQNGDWNPFHVLGPKKTSANQKEFPKTSSLLFNNNEAQPLELNPTSYFSYLPLVNPITDEISLKGKKDRIVLTTDWADPREADPTLQSSMPVEYTDATQNGFMRMVLSAPSDGFGSFIYPNVVTYYAMLKAQAIAKRCVIPPALNQAVNVPFSLKSSAFTADYTASTTYDLSFKKQDYPIQYFLYGPFENYSLFDSSLDVEKQCDKAITSIADSQKNIAGFPLFPSYNSSGTLFLELGNLVTPNTVNFFFELSMAFASDQTNGVTHKYLGKGGWEKLKVLSDTTKDFVCSGIVTAEMESTIKKKHPTMPGENKWICLNLAESATPSLVSQTAYLSPNTFEVSRSDISTFTGFDTPKIDSDTISSPKTAIPQIATILQPFPSFGGKPAETTMAMNKRVSNRLKTKDRVASSEDYFRLIQQHFDTVFYSKAVANTVIIDGKSTKGTSVYVVKAFADASEPNAYTPLVDECTVTEIQQCIRKRASAFANIVVSNFDFIRVKVKASVSIASGFEFAGVRQNIVQGLNLYLSPWIEDGGQQTPIDQEITEAQVVNFIQTIDGVSKVESISFQTYGQSLKNDVTLGPINFTTLKLSKPSELFVSNMSHAINPAIT